MGKISPVSIKYMIHASFIAEGSLEKPDVIGAIFGQTEGLLGNELEMRDLQKEGKIGRIEVELERQGKKTIGIIKIPTALDQSETTLIAAAVETIERIGPSDAQITIDKIEDVRGNKREYIVGRAKELMKDLQTTHSRKLLEEIKNASKVELKEYGKEKLPCGDLSDKEIIVVEGRADVLNLMRNGIKNVIGMNGMKFPDAIKELGKEKNLTLFIDGDRGGKLIAKNVVQNAKVKHVAIAPRGREVEELSDKEILQCLRKKIPVEEFFKGENLRESPHFSNEIEILKKISEENKGTGKALILNHSFELIKKVSVRSLAATLKKIKTAFAIVIDGTATPTIIKNAEKIDCRVIAAKNFATTDTKIKLVSF